MKPKLDTQLITSHQSVLPTAIIFPYDWLNASPDDQWEITNAIAHTGICFEAIDEVYVYAVLKPCTVQPIVLTGFQIIVCDTHGNTHHRALAANADQTAANGTLAAFFDAGAPGLREDFRFFYEQYFRRILAAQKNGGTLHFSASLYSGNTP